MRTINIISSNAETTDALKRYLKHVLKIDRIYITDLNNPFKKKTAYTEALESNLLLVEVFGEGKHKAFQFAKAMEKRTLVLFYGWELVIETEGSFWLALPEGLERLGDKIKEMMGNPAAGREEYEALEERFPDLKERKEHHHVVNDGKTKEMKK